MARRRPSLDEVRGTLEASVAAVGEWVAGRSESALVGPSVLPGWSVRDLVAHVVVVADSVVHLEPLPRSAPVLTLGEYLGGYAAGAATIDARTHAAAAEITDLDAAYRQRWAEAWRRVDALGGVEKVAARRGPSRLVDFLVTRVIEMVVHGDDLARSVPDVPGPVLPPAAVGLVARALLDVLAERHPGQSLEVRVPPVAAVQCLPGPRHTRGTPGSAVETDPLTWIRLAAGREPWSAAVDASRVRASGERCDLAPVLPLL
jgi:uncharacterized protein (TIGR03083 family)